MLSVKIVDPMKSVGEQQRAEHRPLQQRAGGDGAEQEEHPPLRLLEEEVRDAVRSGRGRSAGSARRARDPRRRPPPCAGGTPTAADRRASRRRAARGTAPRAARRAGPNGVAVLERREGGQRDEHQDRVLVQHDEQQVEDGELRPAHPRRAAPASGSPRLPVYPPLRAKLNVRRAPQSVTRPAMTSSRTSVSPAAIANTQT